MEKWATRISGRCASYRRSWNGNRRGLEPGQYESILSRLRGAEVDRACNRGYRRFAPRPRLTVRRAGDLSTFDIYASTQAGATIVLIEENLSTLPSQLVGLLQRERVTITYLVPSILSLMVNYGNLGGHDLSKLRMILFAGEVSR